ncbi:hypothetical protein [Actinoplanes sp. HUAS TT8]|uniref:hypothetical protein n=1 Tax=Actinoplanes sp. HUAS TT8 TaxID=3447453 RepID=UPI003F51E314
MAWVLRNLGVIIATLAVGLSFATAILNRRQRQEDMYLRVHETLIDIEMQRGRRALHAFGEAGLLPSEESPEFAQISRTLSVHNAGAIYVRRGIVPRRWVLREWKNTLCDMRCALTVFREYRQSTYGWPVLVELDSLISSAERSVVRRPALDEQGQMLKPRYLLKTANGPEVNPPGTVMNSDRPTRKISNPPQQI